MACRSGVKCRGAKIDTNMNSKLLSLDLALHWFINLLSDYVCPNAKERCLDGLQCVSRKRLCDGKFQCNDGSDELIRSDKTCPSSC